MKIAVVHAHPGTNKDTDEHARRVVAHLAARGDQVTVVTNERLEPLAPGTRVEVLKPFALSAAGRAKGFDGAVESWSAKEKPAVLYSLGCTSKSDVLRLSEGVRQTRIDLAADSEYARSAEEKVLLEIEARGMQRERAKLVAVPSELVGKDAMKRHHVLPESIRLIRPGVDLDAYSPEIHAQMSPLSRKSFQIDPHEFVVVFVADDWQLHGFDRLLKVWDAVSPSRAGAHLLVAGADPQRAKFEKAVAASRCKDTIRFAPVGTDIARVIHAADLYVLPTRYDAFSRSGLAALASGVPVVTTATNGLAELIDEDVNGIALFGDDVRQTLYQQLLSWTKPDRARSAREPARNAAERCPLENEARETARVLDELGSAAV
ncbi:MAG: glycosyltransferase family 4 protein [Planctomycetota bacterium]|nr:glycosyltransferase family 4 protein [Planctomycetota bacterium]